MAQTEALRELFITSDEPKTLEFQRLVRAMNRLTERVKKVLFETEAKHLDELQQQTQTDPVLGIVNRDTFIKNSIPVCRDLSLVRMCCCYCVFNLYKK